MIMIKQLIYKLSDISSMFFLGGLELLPQLNKIIWKSMVVKKAASFKKDWINTYIIT